MWCHCFSKKKQRYPFGKNVSSYLQSGRILKIIILLPLDLNHPNVHVEGDIFLYPPNKDILFHNGNQLILINQHQLPVFGDWFLLHLFYRSHFPGWKPEMVQDLRRKKWKNAWDPKQTFYSTVFCIIPSSSTFNVSFKNMKCRKQSNSKLWCG